jgi:tetratricopeptide (TPR) repeat protein
MADDNRFPRGQRPEGSRPVHPQPGQTPAKPRPIRRPWTDRVIYVLATASVIVLAGLLVQIWMAHNSALLLTASSLALAPTFQVPATRTPAAVHAATATPTATPSTTERAAQHIQLLQQSWDARDWDEAAGHLTQIASLDDDYPGLGKAMCDTYLHWAGDLEERCQIRQAYALYRRAGQYCETQDAVQDRRELAWGYLSGKWRYDHDRWSQAATVLHTVYEADPDYAAGCQEISIATGGIAVPSPSDTRSLLYAAYLAASRAFIREGQFQEAQKAAEAAQGLAPDSRDVDKLLIEIRGLLTPTPTSLANGEDASGQTRSAGRRIEVSISKQRMYVWQGDVLLYDWVCSTGGSGSGTATGQYQVQSKIPEAWASRWSLRMPYWLGIYNVGSMENGIHALPILSSGSTLWAGYLGTPVSYGCIILSTENARTLYHWADIGTPVWIHH